MPNKSLLQSHKNTTARPFLKWAGGKRQLTSQISQFLPVEMQQGKITQYIEPMVGGGAIFLWLAQTYQLQKIAIGDLNPDLIVAYSTIKYDVDRLIERLLNIEKDYLSLSDEARKDYFYGVRNQYNQTGCLLDKHGEIILNNYKSNWLSRTAQLIFLNRTCFNGLYRVNSQGCFNVPPGKYKKPTICHGENLRAVAKILAKINIYWGDYSQYLPLIDEQTLIYFDPPYRPISATANFNRYSKDSFDDAQQLRLRNFYCSCDRLGAKLLLSNSDPQNIDHSNDFFQTAYSDYVIKKVQAKRNINSKAENRGAIAEILVMNYVEVRG